MSATNNSSLSVDSLEKRVAILERKIAREKKARMSAENKLESYSLEIYQANQSLKAALVSSTLKQNELEYLRYTASDLVSEIELEQLLNTSVARAATFCQSDCGCIIVTDKKGIVQGNLKYLWSSNDEWGEKVNLVNILESYLPVYAQKSENIWKVCDLDTDISIGTSQIKQVSYSHLTLSEDEMTWLILLNSSKTVTPDQLFALNVGLEQLLSGVRKRSADASLLERNAELQESLDKLEKARRQLIQSEKMASLGLLAAGVAHEINNPIAFIRANMEVLQEYLEDYKSLHASLKALIINSESISTADFKEVIENVDLEFIDEDSVDLLKSNIEGLKRVNNIVDDLKSFSHSGGEELTAISITDCVEAALRITDNAFKYDHQVENQLTGLSLVTLGNFGQLQQVFVNLFMNAAYAMDAGGKLTISSTKDEKRLVIHVKDTGQGMDKQTISQLFTPFFTTKPVGVGTGLGLSVSYAILEAHGASITVESELGVGTTFSLSFLDHSQV
ncbi:sensor histidine kinase [Paraglaciecola sp. 2405UD69-4]|uniref:sensor histidine kinase n=1 Tax=Paraglaciecola sp. 2405UD69-4 TaxID=3391836 RepID=UPI0039C9072E